MRGLVIFWIRVFERLAPADAARVAQCVGAARPAPSQSMSMHHTTHTHIPYTHACRMISHVEYIVPRLGGRRCAAHRAQEPAGVFSGRRPRFGGRLDRRCFCSVFILRIRSSSIALSSALASTLVHRIFFCGRGCDSKHWSEEGLLYFGAALMRMAGPRSYASCKSAVSS